MDVSSGFGVCVCDYVGVSILKGWLLCPKCDQGLVENWQVAGQLRKTYAHLLIQVLIKSVMLIEPANFTSACPGEKADMKYIR